MPKPLTSTPNRSQIFLRGLIQILPGHLAQRFTARAVRANHEEVKQAQRAGRSGLSYRNCDVVNKMGGGVVSVIFTSIIELLGQV